MKAGTAPSTMLRDGELLVEVLAQCDLHDSTEESYILIGFSIVQLGGLGQGRKTPGPDI